MALNIKNPETYRLVKELAEATGQTMTGAVTEAVRQQLQRLHAERDDDVDGRLARLLELAAEIRQGAPPGYFDQDFDAVLYDERGLPK
jgi:antitoxin VapB